MWFMTVVLLALLILHVAPARSEDVYKCTMTDGRTVISNTPCAETQNETVLPSTEHSGERGASQTLRDTWDAVCASHGRTARSLAQLRDMGRPASEMLTEETFKSKDMRRIVLQVYANAWWTPTVAQQRIELECLMTRESK